MSKRQSIKREYSLWNNTKRRWFNGGEHRYVSWELPPSFRDLATGEKAPYYVSHKHAQEWIEWLSYPSHLSIQKQSTYKKIRERIAEEQRQIKVISTHGIWDAIEGGEGNWIYTYAAELPKNLRQKYHLNQDFDGALFVSSEDVVEWYRYLVSETEPEDVIDYSIQSRLTSKKIIRQRVQEEKRRMKFAEEHL